MGAEIKCAYLRPVFRSWTVGAGSMRVQVLDEVITTKNKDN